MKEFTIKIGDVVMLKGSAQKMVVTLVKENFVTVIWLDDLQHPQKLESIPQEAFYVYF